MMAKTIVIIGASRGLGDALAKGLPAVGDQVWLVARGEPRSLGRDDGVTRRWIQADLNEADAPSTIATALADTPVDLLLYNAGIWEPTAFSDDYDFVSEDPDVLLRVLHVNLTAAVLSIHQLLPNLMAADHARIILTGSTSGLENVRGREVAYGASKFGLRGAAHALREQLRPHGIGVTCINPGSMANEIDYDAGVDAVRKKYGDSAVPVGDVVALVRCIASLSPGACVKEVDLPALGDPHV
ncbi:MAG TPA: SDR family NAD(P)-dependent oxidoreductase [Caldilineaceae bacterium]|nr:SDR family NAD(P)-dependent oxidoreductase [Caldilineaceae bacterium]